MRTHPIAQLQSIKVIYEILGSLTIPINYGLNLIIISFFSAPALFILKKSKREIFVCILLLMMPIIFFSYSAFHKQKFFENEINKMSYKVRVIGSKIGLDRFNDTSQTESIISDLIELSSPNESSNIFFLWPEGILTNTYQDELYKFSEIFSF